MNDFSDLVPLIAQHLGLNPATLVFYFFVLHRLAVFGSRRIPNDATGWLATLRQVCVVFAVDPSSRVTKDVTVQDVAKQALTTPPVLEKVAAEKGVAVSEVTPNA